MFNGDWFPPTYSTWWDYPLTCSVSLLASIKSTPSSQQNGAAVYWWTMTHLDQTTVITQSCSINVCGFGVKKVNKIINLKRVEEGKKSISKSHARCSFHKPSCVFGFSDGPKNCVFADFLSSLLLHCSYCDNWTIAVVVHILSVFWASRERWPVYASWSIVWNLNVITV